jgi:hypothetical protein
MSSKPSANILRASAGEVPLNISTSAPPENSAPSLRRTSARTVEFGTAKHLAQAGHELTAEQIRRRVGHRHNGDIVGGLDLD